MWKRLYLEFCYSCKNGKYIGSITDDSLIIFDEIIDTTKSTLTKSTSTKTVPTKNAVENFNILIVFILIFLALLIAVKI